jgi:hypothetical protein
VIRPTVPSPPIATPSYSFCARRIVRCGEAELARGFLLQGGGGERRRRAALALLAVDVGDVQRTPPAACWMRARAASASSPLVRLNCSTFLPSSFDSRAVKPATDARTSASIVQYSLRLEGLDLSSRSHDHAQRRRLHAAGRQAALHLAPQHRRQVEADQVVQRAPRLLGIDQVAWRSRAVAASPP